MERWLSIVGIGEDGLPGLGAHGRALVENAEVLAGGARHLAMVPDDGRERLAWRQPLGAAVDEVLARRGRRVCVLATGDPLHHGIGVILARQVDPSEMTIVPAPSAFALATARMGWSRAGVETITLHGRPAALLAPHIQPGARLIVLSDGPKTPVDVADALTTRGFGLSPITVFEHMGGPRERRRDGTAQSWAVKDVAQLNTIAVVCVADAGTLLLPRTPGLPDEAFRHDGQITKREVRAATLAALAPIPGQMLWDVGAGSGAVAIEWMRCHATCRAAAIERNADRIALIGQNADSLGTPDLAIVEGEAPAALAGLEQPDAVFVGGGLSAQGMVAACWDRLAAGGRMVANAVTLEGEQALMALYAEHGGELTRLEISRVHSIGAFTGWQPFRPVTQWAGVKP
jgi:precorrin-6Y C5,15-methyltransferase (decarboxylating)